MKENLIIMFFFKVSQNSGNYVCMCNGYIFKYINICIRKEKYTKWVH